jgi:hypothetical protein
MQMLARRVIETQDSTQQQWLYELVGLDHQTETPTTDEVLIAQAPSSESVEASHLEASFAAQQIAAL